jgi:dolichyl-phosphate beta-glucosyltransferase
LFKKDVALDIFSSQTIGGWSFDVEILFIAKLRGYSIKEVPISWHYYKNSKINTFEDSVHMINEIIQIYNNHKKGLYNKHNVQKKPKYENIPNERMIKK